MVVDLLTTCCDLHGHGACFIRSVVSDQRHQTVRACQTVHGVCMVGGEMLAMMKVSGD